MKLGDSLSSGPAKRSLEEETASLRTPLGDGAEDADGRGEAARTCGDAGGRGDEARTCGDAGGLGDDIWALGDAGGLDGGRKGDAADVASCPATRSLRAPALTSASISFR